MAEQDDRGVWILRGLLCLFIGLVGVIANYANDVDGTFASAWFVLFGGGVAVMISRAFKQEKLAGVILILIGISAAALIYADDTDNLTAAIVVLIAGLGAGAYLILLAPR